MYSTASPLPRAPSVPPFPGLPVPCPIHSTCGAFPCARGCVQTRGIKVPKQECARLPAGRVGKQCQWDGVGSKSP